MAGVPARDRPVTPAGVLALQGAAGNHAVARLLAARPAAPAIARRMTFRDDAAVLDYEQNSIDSKPYRDVQKEAKDLPREITVVIGIPAEGTAAYTPARDDWSGTITVRQLKRADIDQKTATYNSTLAAVIHETQHAIDDLGGPFRYRASPGKEPTDEQRNSRIRTEWRAWAVEAALVRDQLDRDLPVAQHRAPLVDSYRDKASFADPKSTAFSRTRMYLDHYKVIPKPDDAQKLDDGQVLEYIQAHDAWLGEAIGQYYAHVEGGISAFSAGDGRAPDEMETLD